MDPVGPWSTYPYNRLAAVQASTTTGDLHHLPAGSSAPTSTTSATQILPAGFLSPPPVGYEVFSPLFHPGGAAKPPAHYVNQHRQALVQTQSAANVANPKQNADGEYHQGFFDQNAAAWQQSGPFGILPHETGSAKTSGGYENFNTHFVPQHVNKCGPRPRSPSVVNLPQTCIVTSPSIRNATTVNRVTVEKSSVQSQIQTKAQTKIYPDLGSTDRSGRNEPQEQNQSSPNNWAGNKRNFGTYRHYGSENGADTNRKPSPLHSQASPMSHSHSPSSGYPLYSSPLSNISSPQQSNQVTPPLDASVSRTNHQPPGSQSGNIVYSSVITKNNERFQGSNQNCWDERRKFPVSSAQASYTNMEIPNLQNRNLLNMDRQQYYDSSSSNNQVTMTDLSSCRGDPMSIVKNLQQNCIPASDIKQEDKRSRRKSGDNKPETTSSTAMENYYPNPIPPPAHTSGTNSNIHQQQNGSYFEFERWNQPKLFGSQPIHQHQHQGIMVHGPPPPIPYFSTFHLPHHHTATEYPPSVDPITNYNEQPSQQSSQQPQLSHNGGNGSFSHQQQQQQQEEHSKVIVPNIEEELNFLSEIEMKTNRNNYLMKSEPKSNNTAGFMNSYLKFLQGEKDSSPPPTSRNNRKQSSWRKLSSINDVPKDTNGITPIQSIQNTQNAAMSLSQQQQSTMFGPRPISQGDPQDDPRYFPLPKERNKNSFDSSDDGFSSEDDYFKRKLATSLKPEAVKDRPRKGRPPKVGGPGEKKKNKEYKDRTKIKENRELKLKQPQVTPRRETSKRAAKDKCTIKQLIARDEEFDEPGDFADSDSDPAWTPMAKEDVDDDAPVKKNKRGRKKGYKNLVTPETDRSVDDVNIRRKRKEQRPVVLSGTISPSEEDGFFKIGEFVVIQSELVQDWPAIWRVDGKTLLQKYEPFEHNGHTLYRNISTYTSWTPESKKQYISVPVRYKSQGQMETIVEFLRNEMTFVDENFVATVLKENEIYQDNFEVYIQTLISQALDSNFLTEIFQEKDEYFLSNVQTIDDITNKKCEKLTSLLGWPKPTQISVCTWPCYNVIKELGVADSQSKNCAGCGFLGVAVRVLLYGQPYNSTTLEGRQPNPQAVNEKDFLMCKICANRVQLLNKITHQKYLMYIECAKRVADKRISDPQKDTTCILNELLADEIWLNQLFLEVRNSWCEVESLEHNHRTRISRGITE